MAVAALLVGLLLGLVWAGLGAAAAEPLPAAGTGTRFALPAPTPDDAVSAT